MYEIGKLCFGGYLCVVSVWDIRKREIPLWLIAVGGLLAAGLGFFSEKHSIMLMIAGALVGMVFVGISKVTEEAFGYGDSLMIVLAAGLGFFSEKHSIMLMIAGALVGMVFVGISKVTEEAFGYGDSLMIVVAGVYLGFWNVLGLLVWAHVLAALFAGYILIRKGIYKGVSFPFVPFLLAAYTVIVWQGGI